MSLTGFGRLQLDNSNRQFVTVYKFICIIKFLIEYLDPFACDCGLAWLIRDNRNLIAYTSGGKCAGLPFETLDPSIFSGC